MKGIAIAFGVVLFTCGATQPLHFANRTRNPAMLAVIRQHIEKTVSFDHYYSMASVSCGVSCESDWFVDRRDGAILDIPAELVTDGTSTWEFVTRPDSNVLKAYYGPRDGMDNNCDLMVFRLVGHKFLQVLPKQIAACPTH